jgi:hypothetical protein
MKTDSQKKGADSKLKSTYFPLSFFSFFTDKSLIKFSHLFFK